MDLGRGGVVVPAAFAKQRAERGGESAERWLRSIPSLLGDLTKRWRLEIDGSDPWHGEFAIVVPVRRDGEACALKLSQLTTAVAVEARALAAWDGHGSVRLLEAAPELGALLLERLDARRTLFGLPLDEAAAVAGHLLRQLAEVTAPPGVPSLRDVAETIADSLRIRSDRLGRPVPAPWLDAAVGLAGELATEPGDRLIHADLHYGNVLAGTRRPWLAIDPRAVAGIAEHGVAELLWTRLDEVQDADGLHSLLAILVASGDLDAERARAWSIVRCTDYWLWGLEYGLTDDPQRCRRIIEVLVAPQHRHR